MPSAPCCVPGPVPQVNATEVGTTLTAIYNVTNPGGACLPCNSLLEDSLHSAFCSQVRMGGCGTTTTGTKIGVGLVVEIGPARA